MLKTLFGYVQFAHAGLIVYLTLQLYNLPRDIDFNENLLIAQFVLTLLDTFFIRRSFNIIYQLCSVTLFYDYANKKLNFNHLDGFYGEWMAVLFLLKIVYVNNILGSSRNLFFSGDNCSFCRIGGMIYRFFHNTLIEYMFLAIIVMVYKFVVLTIDKSGIDLPQNHVLLYQMIVTATTIGYGDVCPKSRIQMNFFIGAIPFLCGSFAIYGSKMTQIWGNLQQYISGLNLSAEAESLTHSEIEKINEFVQFSNEKKRENELLNSDYYNDWISIAALNYQKNAELIHTIVDSSIGKQIKLKIGSKIRQQYFPQNWVILNSNDISYQLYMIQEGEVQIDEREVKGPGYIFNHQGFFCKASNNHKIVTKSFVVVWTIVLADLEQLGKNCPKFLQKVNANISAYS